MITDPKVGDVVTLDPSNNAGWPGILQLGIKYQITRVVQQGANKACRLRHLYSGKMASKGLTEFGTWACYLIRDEFLTAAYHAKKESAA